MIQHITESDLFQIAIEIIETTAEDDKFIRFTKILHQLCDYGTNDIAKFRVLNYTRVRLCALRDNPSATNESQRIAVNRSLATIVGYIDTELEIFIHHRLTLDKSIPDPMCWTGNFIELVEIIYALDETRCINNGEPTINELFSFFGGLFGIEIKDNLCYNAYADMKRRKNDSRTYFLDKMREKLNNRMQRDDDKERMRK